MDINIETCEAEVLDTITVQKMTFLYNALEDGWTIKKRKKKLYFLQKIMKGKKKFILMII